MAAPCAVAEASEKSPEPNRRSREEEEMERGGGISDQDAEATDMNPEAPPTAPESGQSRCGEEEEVLARTLREARRLGSREDPGTPVLPDLSDALRDMFQTISGSSVPVRSQQKGEPEFSAEQKAAMLLELYRAKPLVFLERFRTVLREEHLDCFNHLTGDYAADFYCKEIRSACRRRREHTRVRNKRYAALQQLITAGEYFSDEQMRERDPLMYEHYVGQYQSEEEIMSQNSKDMSCATSLSDVLLNSCQEEALQQRLEAQRMLEDDCMEEEEEEEDPELPPDEEQEVNSEERALLREEFISQMHQRFLQGKDRDFDYSAVDDNPEFDNLDIVSRDEEERYFDEDDDFMETKQTGAGDEQMVEPIEIYISPGPGECGSPELKDPGAAAPSAPLVVTPPGLRVSPDGKSHDVKPGSCYCS
uniref:Coiled-coil domain containing 97 n=1 Tax=Leptobrachium leishanense TaxID=445787 RepID=A0A8C5QEL7_9ANUR